jgi:isopenicillin N synthase-like dioxygenase
LGGRGWLSLGAEANAFYGHSPSRPDLKESLAFGRELSTGNPEIDQTCSTDNVWPSEIPTLRALCTRYTALYHIHAELLAWFATALGMDPDWFQDRTHRAPHAFNINRYPPLRDTGPPTHGQFRIGAHTDWGTLTFLDRQKGLGGLHQRRGSARGPRGARSVPGCTALSHCLANQSRPSLEALRIRVGGT